METRPVVLIVEDDENIRKLLQYILKQFPVETACASTIAEADSVVERTPISMAFVDYMLPDGMSSALVGRIKSKNPARVTMLTARGEASVRAECIEHGCDDYILKPFSVKQIESSVRSLICS